MPTASLISTDRLPSSVLVVEDDPVNLNLVRRILDSVGIHYRTASDGEAALAVLGEWMPDAVVMDMSMPTLDGWETTRRLRANATLNYLPILGMSAHAMAGDRAKALTAGCDMYLTKPFRPSELLAALSAVMSLDG